MHRPPQTLKHMVYGMKILHGIKFYGFTVGAITVKFNSVNIMFHKHLYLNPLRTVAAYVSCKQIAITSPLFTLQINLKLVHFCL